MILALTPLMAALGPLALLLLMGVVFAETGLMLGFFLPGDSLVFTAGVLVAGGAMHMPLWLVAASTFVAAHVEFLLVGVGTLSLMPGAIELLRRRVRGHPSEDRLGRSTSAAASSRMLTQCRLEDVTGRKG